MSQNNTAQDSEAKHDLIPEVAGGFHSASGLDTAVEQLGLAGVTAPRSTCPRPGSGPGSSRVDLQASVETRPPRGGRASVTYQTTRIKGAGKTDCPPAVPS